MKVDQPSLQLNFMLQYFIIKMEKKFNINIGEYKKEPEVADEIIKKNVENINLNKTLRSMPEPPLIDVSIPEVKEKVEPIDEGMTEIKGKCTVTGIETYHWTKKDGVIKDIVEEHETYKASIKAKHPEAKDFREAYKLEQEVK